MTDYGNDFAGQSAGTAVSAVNSATSGTPVTPTLNGATCVYESTIVPKNLMRSIKLTRTSGSQSFFGMYPSAESGLASNRTYFYASAIANLGSGTSPILRYYSDLGGNNQSLSLNIQMDGTNKIQLQDPAGSNHSAVSASGISAATWYYALLRDTADATAGIGAVDIYQDSDDQLFTSLSWSGFNTRGGNVIEVRHGIMTANAWTPNLYFAGLYTRIGSVTPLERYFSTYEGWGATL